MSNILTVAKYTFKEIYRSKVLVMSLLAAMAVYLASFIAMEFSYGNPLKVALDFGLGTSTFFSVLIAIFLGVSLISDEVESRTIYMILARPISRSSFIIGKVLGMSLILFMNMFIINIAAISIFVTYGGSFDSMILASMLFSFFESLLVLFVVILFSLYVNRLISVVGAFLVYIFGHAVPNSLDITFVATREWLKSLLTTYTYIFPNFDRLNLKPFVIYESTIPDAYYGNLFIYGILYSLALVLIITVIFSKKELN
jgi:ABC-2 type transport system permease protein